MFESVEAALDRQDYKTAAQLLKPLRQQNPDHPFVQLYVGRLYEALGKLPAAAAAYRQILQSVTHPKVVNQARQGLQRLEAIAQAQQVKAISQATADPDHAKVGFLILEPIVGDARHLAAQSFARIMRIDAYTARLQLPSRGWRLYRTGAIGELEFYGQQLRKAGIPAFWTSLERLQGVRVLRVNYLQGVSPGATVICQNEVDQTGSLAFDWSEVTHRVEGLLPIFEDVVDLDSRKKLMRKEKTQDYAQVLDLHLPKRHCILRFCDRTYQFQQGVLFEQDTVVNHQGTTRIRWNLLAHFLGDRLASVPCRSDFTAFAETTQEHFAFLQAFPTHIHLFRKAPTYWDAAFHLYSGLIFKHSFNKNRGL
ncbi:MAG: tetratricopeptide repeat protein [Timaviella obliquedivisa GSE-PSE-MK23-08B]|jgi:tetratricopeptide (TPR) repeat protein|nr:tetratricopeptide repeat protein [Timaviella obliquedivisa GSE-PSE-MK23-08B]